MKGIALVAIILVILGASCTHTVQKQPSGQERALKPESALLEEKYELLTVQGMGMPLAEHRYLLAKDGETEIQIRNAEEFAQIVREIASPEDALELVRLLTSQEFRPFLKDIFYSEVHKKMEPKTEGDEEDRWFAIAPKQYETWKLHEPVATEEDAMYKIERFVASYPRVKVQEQEHTLAQLLKIWEWVDAQGKYTMEIQEVIAEGGEIQKILLFTK